MDLIEILSPLNYASIVQKGGAFLLLAMTLIQLSPIKINPWSWLAKMLGRALNSEIMAKVDKLDKDLQEVRKDVQTAREETSEEAAVNCRVRILRFGDEMRHGMRHSKDHFDQTLIDIDRYEQYCEGHPAFANSITESTVKQVRETYCRLCEENYFL